MSRLVVSLASAVARGWTHVYTSGMPPLFRDARRREIACDLYELTHEAERDGTLGAGTALHILARTGLGVADDVTWRVEHLSLRRQLHVVEFAVAAFVAVVLVVASLMFGVMRSGTWPTPPLAPKPVIQLNPPPPPPAPPPPPPRAAR